MLSSFPSELERMVAAIPPGLETKEAPDLELQIKAIKDEILAGIGGSAEKMKAMQVQLDALDTKLAEKHGEAYEGKSLQQHLEETDAVARLIKDKRGQASFSVPLQLLRRKATTFLASGQGFVTPGVYDADRSPGIVTEARRKLTVRNALTARPTTLPLVYWVKVQTPIASASPMMQDEGLVKNQSSISFTTANSTIRTIATFLKMSRQSLDDFSELGAFLQNALPYYVNRQEETQLLSGDNTGDNLNGLITQASPFNTALLPASAAYTRIDVGACAIEQIGIADEIDPTFVIINKTDWWNIKRTKDTLGRYIVPPDATTLWDLQVVQTNSIAQGTFLVGSGDPAACEIRDRMEMEVLLSYEDSDNWQRNLVSLRAERRMCLTVMHPGAFVTGTWATSP